MRRSCFHCSIYIENEQLRWLRDYAPPSQHFVEEIAPLPESPLFFSTMDLDTINNDAHCSETTLELLRSMCYLTDDFLRTNAEMDGVDTSDRKPTSPRQLEFACRASVIREKVASLPSAYIPILATSNDWVYEACRIAALIYATALDMHVPFSVAASYNSSLPDGPGAHLSLAEELLEALKRTDLFNIWSNMSGVLYWILAVGAAAARTTSTLDMCAPTTPTQEREQWVRRCLILHGTRTMILLAPEHAIPVLNAQKRLLRVQELIAYPRSPQHHH